MNIFDAIGDEEMFAISRCINRIENLQIHSWLSTINGFQSLHKAIQNRPSPVSREDNLFFSLLA